MSDKKIFLIDGSHYLFRYFYGMPRLTNSKGLPTNALLGFARLFVKLTQIDKPDYIAVAMDPHGPTFRNEIYPAYKANRSETPEEIVTQYPYVEKLAEAFGIPLIVQAGYEGDDLLGTLAVQAEKEGLAVYILASDKDMLQLVSSSIRIMDAVKEKVYGLPEVEEKFGLPPEKIVEIMALTGDVTDNVPGVPGVGEKTAVKLIKEYGNLDNLLAHAGEITAKKVREGLLQTGREGIELARRLVTIDRNVPLARELNELTPRPFNPDLLFPLLKELEFYGIIRELAGPEGGPEPARYRLVTEPEQFDELLQKLSSAPVISVDTETTHQLPMWADLVGLSFSTAPHDGYYIPLGHVGLEAPRQLPKPEVLDRLKPILEDASRAKVGQNIKYDLLVLRRAGIELKGVTMDSMLASYLINPGRFSHSLDSLAREYLDHQTITFDEVVGKGRGAKNFSEVPLEDAANYSAEDADVTLQLVELFSPRLKEEGQEELFRRVELPLIDVLADMEEKGVLVDAGKLKILSKEFEEKLNALSSLIFESAGTSFNLNSPQQLGEVLFERLKLPGKKKTKTGYSTDVRTLSTLAGVHPLPNFILDYRSLAKLKSTYIDTLPALIHPKTGRIHTSFHQAVTATGRLSSSDPNLQNIPIRSPEGRRIRETFIAAPGTKLLCADYSQIELRLLAHFSGDEAMLEAFRNNEDIHRATAARMFHVSPEAVDDDMRRKAKSINFGIIYGMGAFRLAEELRIDRGAAQAFIDEYFLIYQGVSRFIAANLKFCEERGFVTSLLGRRRNLPELASTNSQTRSSGERLAINTPIQGTAADLIKLAMLNIHRRLQKEFPCAAMLLQVHDELVFEVPEAEVEKLGELVKREMENVYPLNVPLTVSVNWGDNWLAAH